MSKDMLRKKCIQVSYVKMLLLDIKRHKLFYNNIGELVTAIERVRVTTWWELGVSFKYYKLSISEVICPHW